ncbi:uncharacterized protein TRIADDRAFT_57000 [Trichoplax adhaerens]|uniref:Uncharacterized protein n=1 Tax=Trichoplax adhaerens TaxID=10228 RepID=B3RX53_TRIAD|nr:hypothetical protein TRIADDRAFT_57000 [Trichoplax adhaerens]EDV25245.1 hypothetical protein TRIADDRAFT_57000 [Trichoplax adhaerens]|eukprot:XP_002113135.1 hypothetical protein TRIADDRAFT_57000 [Trichoplax adhaerens]
MDASNPERSQEKPERSPNRSESVSNFDRGQIKARQKKTSIQSSSEKSVTFGTKLIQQSSDCKGQSIGLPNISERSSSNRKAGEKSWNRQRSYTESSIDLMAVRKRVKARYQKRESLKNNTTEEQDDECSDSENLTGLREKRQVLIHGLSYYKYRMVVDWLRHSRLPSRIVLPVI